MYGTGLVKGAAFTFKKMFARKVTTKYPKEEYKFPNRFRGIQKFYPDKCIVCNQCVIVCPTQCISLVGKKSTDPERKGKVIDTYEINFELCILCDLCTEVCPTEAIVMTNNFELATFSRDELFKDMQWLDDNDTNVREVNKP